MIPEKLIKLIIMTHKNTQGKVILEGKVSETFEMNRELRQGGQISPILFNLLFGGVVRKSNLYMTGLITNIKTSA